MSVLDQASLRRQRLGQALRELRERAGLSGAELARRTGIGQPRVSRIEHGRLLPSEVDLDRWLEASGASASDRANLVRIREQVTTETVTWRRYLRGGLQAVQDEVRAAEAMAARIREYQIAIVPGLLQTPAAARVVAEARYGVGHPNVAIWVDNVTRRQPLLYEAGRRFEFVIGEAALRWMPTTAALGQLDRIRGVAELDNVTVGVLPLDREVLAWHAHHFVVFEPAEGPPMVHLELLAGGQNLRDPDDVVQFTAVFERLLEIAVVGEEAVVLLERLAAEL